MSKSSAALRRRKERNKEDKNKNDTYVCNKCCMRVGYDHKCKLK